ncbi:endonuclease domain-containing protein [Nocardia sp. NPDC056000]|uniref:endonuclease domain-containing protein n=1 Tax=Nocardia sp. NPDC056000 TaxID=3345674 RepID=UPI0035E2144C
MLPEPELLEVTVPPTTFRTTPAWLRLYRRTLPPACIDESWGFPATTPARTLLDCMTVVAEHDAERLVDTHARTASPELLDLRTHLRGSPTLRKQLRDAAPDAASEPERLFTHALLQRGIRLLANHPVGPYYGDFVDPRSHTIIEIDGRAFHSDARTFREDRRRQNALVLAGWFILRYAAADIFTHIDVCADEVAAVVRRRRRNRPLG